jgi:hypothetical protein
MADFSAAAPIEPRKSGDYLHDRSRIPGPPAASAGDWTMRFAGLALGILLAMGAAALIFELRDAWESHRDWVPPAALVPAALGAIALGHLAARGKINAIAVPMFLLFFAVFAPVMNIWIHHEYPGKDGLRLAFTILGTITFALAVAWLLVSLIWVEKRDPTRPPEPEM